MQFDILSLFPEYFDSPFETSILKKARESGLLHISLTDIRFFAEGKHKKVDDRPYGGGPGMLLMAKPLCQAIRSVKSDDAHVIYLSPQGKPLTSEICQRLAQKKHIVFVCGHYEGIDERVIEKEIDEEISIGDYVLTNGCIAAIVLVDAISRFIPGVLGHKEAAYQDSFQDQKLDAPHYTRPPEFEGLEVPPVLISGNHEEIRKWRHQKAMQKTMRVRPDLIGR
ncbi:MAG: tRNA (guanosine(37)-N1)-methyltransferase TrmD [Chlamydiae bacterium]|nr:tRNA (guanosine(37)-N1)-methyltransferase TrmD [Chlamydiota bacterium]